MLERIQRIQALTWAVVLAACCACGGELNDPTMPRLAVNGARWQGTVKGTTPQAGRRFVSVNVSLRNNGEAPLPANFVLFTLETEGLAFLASPHTALAEKPCASDLQIIQGSSITCDLVFEVHEKERPRSLRYDAVDGRKATASVSLEACTWCGTDCVNLKTSLLHCGQCNRQLTNGQACVDGNPVCLASGLTLCGLQCADLRSDPKHCGACNRPVAQNQRCVEGMPQCSLSHELLCGGQCVSVRDDPMNCGQCGRQCVEGYCAGGARCVLYHQDSTRADCDSLCRSLGYTCQSAKAWYSYYSSSCSYAYERTLACAEVPPTTNSSTCATSFDFRGCWCQVPFR
jgi:hypothetical protein